MSIDDKPKDESEHKETFDNSQRMIERTKDLVSRLKKDIESQEKLLARQRADLTVCLMSWELNTNNLWTFNLTKWTVRN